MRLTSIKSDGNIMIDTCWRVSHARLCYPKGEAEFSNSSIFTYL